MSDVLKRIACPVCQSEGKDTDGNNLTIFANGAYACGANQDHTKLVKNLRPDLASNQSNGHRPASSSGRIVAEYSYEDVNGQEIYQAIRREPKGFQQRHKVNGEWVWNMKGVERILYRLPKIITAPQAWVCEGERDVHTLESCGIVATTSVGGAKNWKEKYAEMLTGKDVVLCGDNDRDGEIYIQAVLASVLPVAKSVRRVRVPAPHKDVSDLVAVVGPEKAALQLGEILHAAPFELVAQNIETVPETPSDLQGNYPANDISDHLAGMSDSEARAAVEELLRQPDPLDALLDSRRFDLAKPPAKPVPVLLINEKAISSAGNLTVVQALAKAGKTSFEAACIASLMGPTGDCLGVAGQNPDGLAVIHFDTEQSDYDHFEVVRQCLLRAGRSSEPEWLRSYHLADVPTKDRRKALAHEMKRAATDKRLCAVFVDGVADLCIDPNDPAEAFGLVEELHRLAITYHCPIICILHENPGTETGKTRGHLGSQLERKAETNLRLSKSTDGVTTVFTERSRHCHIPKESGPRFQWDDVALMHLTCGTRQEVRRDSTAQKHHETAVGIFGNDPAKCMSWSELIAVLEPIAGDKKKAEHRIEAMKKYNAIRYDFGKYRLCNP